MILLFEAKPRQNERCKRFIERCASKRRRGKKAGVGGKLLRASTLKGRMGIN